MHSLNSPGNVDLLSEWRWLVGGMPSVLGWSKGGDLFLADRDGAIHLLDPGAGTVERIADSQSHFETQLSDANNADDLLQADIVSAFESMHGPLPAGRCLSYTMLPVLGGTYTLENRYPLSIREHAGVTGDMHRQIRDLPDGTEVEVRVK
jgi:hypothetical protein